MNYIVRSIRQVGNFLGDVILPNIGAFITWGFLTVLFGTEGWFPNEAIQILLEPMIRYMIPLLLAYTAGNIIYKQPGGTISLIASLGVIVSSSSPMILGVLVISPISAYILKEASSLYQNKVDEHFILMLNTILIAILGGLLSLFGLFLLGPAITWFIELLSQMMNTIIQARLLPLSAIIIEPLKVVYLNNILNHGILMPLGIQDSLDNGISILFLLEANPGPGAGVLLSYWIFGNKSIKKTTPFAFLIHFIGGIHEIYFPYVLMKPKLIIALILGSISGIIIFQLLNSGLVAPAIPGSIITVLSMAPKDKILSVVFGVFVSFVFTFLFSSVFIIRDKKQAITNL